MNEKKKMGCYGGNENYPFMFCKDCELEYFPELCKKTIDELGLTVLYEGDKIPDGVDIVSSRYGGGDNDEQ